MTFPTNMTAYSYQPQYESTAIQFQQTCTCLSLSFGKRQEKKPHGFAGQTCISGSSLYANLHQSYYKWIKRGHHMNIKVIYNPLKLDKHMVGASTVHTSQYLSPRYPIHFISIQTNFDLFIKKNNKTNNSRCRWRIVLGESSTSV